MNIWSFLLDLIAQNPALVAAFFAAIESSPNLTPTEKAAIATFIQATTLYASKTAGWITFVPDAAGGTPLQIFHIQP